MSWRKSSYSGNNGGACVEVGAAHWRKSSYSGNNGGTCVEVAAHWRKSSRSGNNGGNCVEVGSAPGAVLVRDTKDRQGPALSFSVDAWRTFVASLKER